MSASAGWLSFYESGRPINRTVRDRVRDDLVKEVLTELDLSCEGRLWSRDRVRYVPLPRPALRLA